MTMIPLALMFGGLFFITIAGVGLIKFPTFFMKMQATSKAATLGVFLCLVAIVFIDPSIEVKIKAIAIALFLFATTPIATHAMAHAARKVKHDSDN